MKIYQYAIDELREKIYSAFPYTFSKALKQKGGNYFPLDTRELKFTDQQIRRQIERQDSFGFQYSVDTVTEFLQHVKGNRVIDLGCGFGVEALIMGELAKGDIEIYALDADKEKISLLESVLKNYEFTHDKKKKKIVPVEGDILNLNLPNYEPFNGVFTKHVIGYIASCKSKDVNELQEFMKETAAEVMRGVKRIAPNGWLTLRDRDIVDCTREAFMDGILETLGPSSSLGHEWMEYKMVPVKVKLGEQTFDTYVLGIDRPIQGSMSGEKYKKLRKAKIKELKELKEAERISEEAERISEYFLKESIM